MRYDIAVIGNDDAAFEMLTLATASGARSVAILPVSRHSSWIVADALRGLITDLLVDRSSTRQRQFKNMASPRLLQNVISRAVANVLQERVRNLTDRGVEVILGDAHFQTGTQKELTIAVAGQSETIFATNVVIGTGVQRTAMHRPVGMLPFHCPESLLTGNRLPVSACIVGGGEFGSGLAALMSLFGVETRLVARQDNTSVMLELASACGVVIGHHPADVGLGSFPSDNEIAHAEVVDCRRVIGFTDNLNLSAIDIEPDENGQLWCAGSFETWRSGVYGIGSVVGFPPDTALHPSVQAERIMGRIVHCGHRPHLLKEFRRASLAV